MIPSVSGSGYHRSIRQRLSPAPRIATASTPKASAASSSAQESDNERLARGPVVLFESISLEGFNKWLEKNEARIRRWQYEPLDDDKGRVVIYSLPNSVHEKTSHGIYLSIMEQVVRAGNDDRRTVFNTKSTTFQVGGSRRQQYQEADDSLTPANLRVGGHVLAGTAEQDPFPNVVIEVAYKNQTFAKLLEKLQNW
ncbi:hypothetical protein AeNC1_016386, partial [Aphanomyces euteiches]